MNLIAILAIYKYEMARTFRTLLQSLVAPVVSTSLYFVVFGTAIGSRIETVEGVPYGAFIVPGLIMLTVLMQSISNASFGIYFPKWSGTIYELLSAPVGTAEIVLGYVGAAATKSVLIGVIILATSAFFVPLQVLHPVWMVVFLLLTALTFSLFGFVLGIWATSWERLQFVPALIIAGLIKRSSPGPVFYTQERMGLDGKAFTVYKFRSMPVDAEDASGPVWARDDDPRATRIGRWLRRHDVDELPQFWNVLRGDMSIVGPRPERPFFVEQFKHKIPQYMLRHKVKAGITGWAQVNGWRGNTSLEKRIEFDLYYIENWSLSLDFKIMWLTLLRGLHRLA